MIIYAGAYFFLAEYGSPKQEVIGMRAMSLCPGPRFAALTSALSCATSCACAWLMGMTKEDGEGGKEAASAATMTRMTFAQHSMKRAERAK